MQMFKKIKKKLVIYGYNLITLDASYANCQLTIWSLINEFIEKNKEYLITMQNKYYLFCFYKFFNCNKNIKNLF